MLAMSLVNTATNILIGSVTTKVFDSVVTSKLTQKQEKNKWLREKKLNLFSELSEEVLSLNCDNLSEKEKSIKNIASKIILLSNNSLLEEKLENYLFILEEYPCTNFDINLCQINNELLELLSSHIQDF